VVPKNSIPPLMKINSMELNPDQMIGIMALALVNPASETRLPVRMSYIRGEAAVMFPKTRPLSDIGFLWTLKPAPLAMPN